MDWTQIYNNMADIFKNRGETKIFGPFDDWTKGRPIYYGFVIRVTDTKVVNNVTHAQESLAEFPFISLHPPHFFHITLKALGFFDPTKEFDDSLNQEDIDGWIAKAEDIAFQTNPFNITFRGLNSFSNSTMCPIYDESGDLLKLISSLDGIMFDLEKHRIPHLTIGYYTKAEKNGALVNCLSELHDRNLGTLKVDSFQLIKHNLAGQKFYEPLVTLREFRLIN